MYTKCSTQRFPSQLHESVPLNYFSKYICGSFGPFEIPWFYIKGCRHAIHLGETKLAIHHKQEKGHAKIQIEWQILPGSSETHSHLSVREIREMPVGKQTQGYSGLRSGEFGGFELSGQLTIKENYLVFQCLIISSNAFIFFFFLT